MGGKVGHRDVGPLVQLFRDLVRGRKFVPHLRFSDELSSRTQPPPKVPGGPFHKTSKVYYHTRDARRLVEPPTIIAMNKKLSDGLALSANVVKPTTPNDVYHGKLIPPPEPIYPDQIGQSIFQK